MNPTGDTECDVESKRDSPDQVSYTAAQPHLEFVTPFLSHTRPSYPSPHSFLILSIIVTLVCTLLCGNATAALFGVPAVTVAATSFAKSRHGKWRRAHILGNVALYLTVITAIYTTAISLSALGACLGVVRRWQETNYFA